MYFLPYFGFDRPRNKKSLYAIINLCQSKGNLQNTKDIQNKGDQQSKNGKAISARQEQKTKLGSGIDKSK